MKVLIEAPYYQPNLVAPYYQPNPWGRDEGTDWGAVLSANPRGRNEGTDWGAVLSA